MVAPLVGRFAERRSRWPFTPASSSGNMPDDAILANARASSSREVAAFRVWLLLIARSSYWSSSLSPKIFHQAFFGSASLGLAVCHGTGDCQFCGTGASGLVYFGPPASAYTLDKNIAPRRKRNLMSDRPPSSHAQSALLPANRSD